VARQLANGAAGLLAVLGIVGCTSAAAHQPSSPIAEVTGFAVAAAPAGTAPGGPVTVQLTGPQATRLAQVVSELPAAAPQQISCHEPLGLMYRISFSAGAVAPARATVEGYECGAAVSVTPGGAGSSWRRDTDCALIRAVRAVLPQQAKATQTEPIGCGS
jgi:hypothetical protein